MKSPFPGMDPYLEGHWLDVHTSLVTLSRESLNAILPSGLVARSEERLVIDAEEWPDEHGFYPDVRVFEPGSADPSQGEVTLDAPFKLVVDLDPLTERWVKIIKPDDEQLITVIEFISPRNKKPGTPMDDYHAKRNEFLQSGANVVEIDLVRRGDWRGLLRPHRAPPKAESAYRATIRLGGDRAAHLFPLPLNHPLRPIPIPLRRDDPKVFLELQPLIDRVYAGGRYSVTLDYGRPLEPPLTELDSRWVDELLRAAGKR